MRVAIVVYDHERETALGGDKGYEPFGALMVIGALLEAGIEAQLFARSLYSSLDELTLAIIIWKPDFVGFSTMYCNIRPSVDLAEVLEEALRVPMIFGGWHTSGVIWERQQGHPYPSLWQFLMKPNRYGIFGEGIRVMPELVRALGARSDPTQIPGVCCIGDNGEIVTNPSYPRLSPNAWPQIPYEQYPIIAGRRTIINGQGCKNNCAYCQTPILYPGCRRLVPEAAAQRVVKMLNDPKVQILWVADEDLSGDQDWFLRFCGELELSSPRRRALSTFANAKDFKGDGGQKMIEAMAQASWDEVLVGIETPDPNILKGMHRTTALGDISRLCQMTKEAGIRTIGTMMIGYPNQTEDALRQSLKIVQSEVPLDRAYLSFMMPLPGTPLYHNYRQRGLIREDVPPEDWTGIEPVVKTPILQATLKATRLEFISSYD